MKTPASLPIAASRLLRAVLSASLLLASHGVHGQTITVPNASFESPSKVGVSPYYQQFPVDAAGVFGTWERYGTTFHAVYEAGRYGVKPTGLDALQAATIAGGTGGGIFQDTAPYNGTGNTDLYWKVGKTYTMTVSVYLRSDSQPPANSSLGLRLYFRPADQGNAGGGLATTVVTRGVSALGTGAVNDYTVSHTVLPGAPEIGKPVGIWFFASSGTGGDWGIDNIRLIAETAADSDGDGLLDSWELANFIQTGEDPVADKTAILARQSSSGDPDTDGLDNLAEFNKGTNPNSADTDNDGLGDASETNTGIWLSASATGTNPLKPDTDGDLMLDGQENNSGTYLSAADTGTNPNLADTDGDGFADYLEIARSSNPVVNASRPGPASASPLVELSASSLAEGTLTEWSNTGTIGRSFTPDSAPDVTTIGGIKGVTFSGNEVMSGPVAPPNLIDASPRTIQAWIYNPSPSTEETVVSWGRRGGPNGALSSFMHGTSANFGALGHWGTQDMPWGTDAASITHQVKTGSWTYIAFTYDGGGTNVGNVYSNGTLAYTELLGQLITRALDTTAFTRPLPIRLAGQNAPDGSIATDGQKGSLTIARLKIHDRVLSAMELGLLDSDSDGMKDWFEEFYGLNPALDDSAADSDGDGLSNMQEQAAGTNPNLADTDGDGMSDGWENTHFGNQAAMPFGDADNDGAFNIDEFEAGRNLLVTRDLAGRITGVTPSAGSSDPINADSQPDADDDGLPDGWERQTLSSLDYGPADDIEPDGASNLQEFTNHTNPLDADSDDDGINDGPEINRLAGGNPAPTDPNDPDSDNDGLSDLAETGTGMFVSAGNTGSNPLAADSDGDTYADGLEVVRKSDPNNASSLPADHVLLANWNLNESTGTTAASLPDAAYPGTFGNVLAAPPTLAWEPPAGIAGALRITDPADRVMTPEVNLTHGFTVMGWIKPDATQPEWARFLTTRFQDGFLIGRDGSANSWKFIIAGNFTLSGGTITANEWQHVCGTYDGTTARLYINGVEAGSSAMPPPVVPVQPLHIGSEGAPERSFAGLYDEIKVYSGAMPSASISSLYNTEHTAIIGLTPYQTWAASFGLDPGGNGAPTVDHDGDGSLNEVEFALGLSPVDPNSRFTAALGGAPPSGLTLSWPSKEGATFSIRSSGDLANWSTLEATVPAAAAPATTTSWISGPLAPDGKRFYRVELNP